MKILYLCHRFPFPPKRGGKIRPFNMIRHLHASHEVTVASIARSKVEAAEGRGLADHCSGYEMTIVRNSVQVARMVTRLPTLVPSSFGYFHSSELLRKIERLLRERKFDLIFVHCSSMARYVAHVRHIPKILDFGDMDSQKWLDYGRFKPFPVKLGYRLEGIKLTAEEKRLARAFDVCTTTTREEWRTLEGYATGAATDWFPNGVDSEYFAPVSEPYDPQTISFVGRMDYYPNQECMFEFCTNTLPLLRKTHPRLRLVIVGAEPPPAVQRLGRLPGVTVTGSVPDVRPFVRGSACMVAPLNIARGTQNKILESMSMGVPVVASAKAAGGVDAVPGEHLLVARTPAEYAAAVALILDQPGERARLANEGRQRVRSNHDWSHSMRRLDGIIAGCLSAGTERSGRGLASQLR
jgi:sugar transferase (PEP-CTERM/EpsH1 system associated)